MVRPINKRALAALVLIEEHELLDYEGIADKLFRDFEGRDPEKNPKEYRQLVSAIKQMGYRWDITDFPDNILRDGEGNLVLETKGKSKNKVPVLLPGHTKAAWLGKRWHEMLKTTTTREGNYYALGKEYIQTAISEIEATAPVRQIRQNLDQQTQELEIYRKKAKTRAKRRGLWVRMMKIAALFLMMGLIPLGYTVKVVDEELAWKLYHEEGPAKAFDYLKAYFSFPNARYSELYALAWGCYLKGYTAEAEKLTEEILGSSASLNFKARAHFVRSLIALEREQFELARELNRSAFEYYEMDHNHAGMTTMEIEASRITLYEGNPKKAREVLNEIVIEVGGETEEIINLYLNIYLTLNDLPLAEEYALKLIDQTDKPLFLIFAYQSIAQIATARNDWDKAIEFLSRAMAINLDKINSPAHGEYNLHFLRCLMKCKGINYGFLENLLRERAVANGNKTLLSRLNDPCPCE